MVKQLVFTFPDPDEGVSAPHHGLPQHEPTAAAGTFTAWIATQILEQRLTQSEVAFRAQVAPSYLSEILAGKQGAGVKVIRAIGATLGATDDQIGGWLLARTRRAIVPGATGVLLELVYAQLQRRKMFKHELLRSERLAIGPLERGEHPQPATVQRWLDWLDIRDPDERNDWISSIADEHTDRLRQRPRPAPQPRVTRPAVLCRECGRASTESNPAHQRRLLSYDANTHTYFCSTCYRKKLHDESLVRTRCIRCGSNRQVPLYYARRLKSRVKNSENPRLIGFLCRDCRRQDTIVFARQRLLAKYGVRPTDSAEDKREVLAEHIRAVVRRIGGRRKLFALRDKALADRGGKITPKGKLSRVVHALVYSQRAGEFRLCPSCRKLIYLPPAVLSKGATGLHRVCYVQWLQTAEYKEWRTRLGSTASPGFARRLAAHPHPVWAKPRGRTASPKELSDHLRWLLMRYLLHRSWEAIAREENVHRDTIRSGVETLARQLPVDWNMVFGSRITGKRLDTLLPLSRLRQT